MVRWQRSAPVLSEATLVALDPRHLLTDSALSLWTGPSEPFDGTPRFRQTRSTHFNLSSPTTTLCCTAPRRRRPSARLPPLSSRPAPLPHRHPPKFPRLLPDLCRRFRSTRTRLPNRNVRSLRRRCTTCLRSPPSGSSTTSHPCPNCMITSKYFGWTTRSGCGRHGTTTSWSVPLHSVAPLSAELVRLKILMISASPRLPGSRSLPSYLVPTDSGLAGLSAVQLHEAQGRCDPRAREADRLDRLQWHAQGDAQLQRGGLRPMQPRGG